MTRGTVPDPYDVIARLRESNDALRQSLRDATAKPYRGFWRGAIFGGLVTAAVIVGIGYAVPAFAGTAAPGVVRICPWVGS